MQALIATLVSIVCSALLVFGGYRLHLSVALHNPLWWLWLLPIFVWTLAIAVIVAWYATRYLKARGY